MLKISFTPFPILETDRLTLRPLMETDDEAIRSLRSNDGVNKYIKRPKSITVEDARAFIKRINDGVNNNSCVQWAISLKDDSQLIGTICLWNFSADKETAELGYDLFPEFHRKGLMSEAFRPVINFAFEAGFMTIEAFTHKDNARSISLLEKFNFRLDPERRDDNNADYKIFILAKQE